MRLTEMHNKSIRIQGSRMVGDKEQRGGYRGGLDRAASVAVRVQLALVPLVLWVYA